MNHMVRTAVMNYTYRVRPSSGDAITGERSAEGAMLVLAVDSKAVRLTKPEAQALLQVLTVALEDWK